MKKTLEELIEAKAFPVKCDFAGSQRILIGFNLEGLIVIENPDGSYGLIEVGRILTDYTLPKQEPRIASPAWVRYQMGTVTVDGPLGTFENKIVAEAIISEIQNITFISWPAKDKDGNPIEYQIPNED